MKKTSTRRIALLGAAATLGAALATAIVAPPEAGAAPSYQVRTEVTWSGVECLSFNFADRYGDIHQGTGICNSQHSTSVSETAFRGDLVGIDPIMGANRWIACQVYVNGVQIYADFAESGDGTDVSCLRRLV